MPIWFEKAKCETCSIIMTLKSTSRCCTSWSGFLTHQQLHKKQKRWLWSVFQEVTTQPMMGFDPLPPLDSVISYTQPERYCTVLYCHTGTFYSFNFLSFCNHCTEVCVCVSSNRQNGGASNESTLSLFFRSLLPNFNFQVSAVYQPWYIYENTGHFSL